MASNIDFHYITTGTGELSGPSFVAQTELAMNELGGFIEQVETAADTAVSTATAAQTAAETAQTTADGALSQAQTATALANQAQQAANAAQTTANNAQTAAQTAQTAANSAQDTADEALAAAQGAQGTADGKAPVMHASAGTAYGSASDTLYGHVRLSDATDGTQTAASDATAATPYAVAQVSAATATAQQAADAAQQTASAVQSSLSQYANTVANQLASLMFFETTTAAIDAQSYAGNRTQLYLTDGASASTGLPSGISYPCWFWAEAGDDGNTSMMFVLSGNVLYSQSGVNTTPDEDTATWVFTGWQQITYTAATTSALGVVKADGTTVEVAADGTLSINTALLSTVYKFKGSVATVDDLPADAEQGDVYNVTATDANYAWTGTEWDNIGGIEAVDPSPVQNSTNPVSSGGVYTAIENLQGQITTDTVQPSSTTPLAAGTASVGVETAYARGDHVHPAQVVPEYIGATGSTAGTAGLVPAAASGQQEYVFGGDGEWHPADSTPVGAVVWYAGDSAPEGYLLCNGATVGRSTYSALFAAIGTTYGAGDGSTTFGLPNLIGRVAWGAETPGTYLEAGLPNIVGSFTGQGNRTGFGGITGAFYGKQTPEWTAGEADTTGGSLYVELGFDASRCSAVYGTSDTVQPPALTLVPYIKVFSAATNQGTIDITSLANDIAALDAERLKQIGQIQTFVSTNLPDGWMILDGSSILFADWPEFEQVYNEGRFSGMTLSEADPEQVGKMVLNGSTGVYLPDLEGLYIQASSTANGGKYLAAGLPNVTGNSGAAYWSGLGPASGPFYAEAGITIEGLGTSYSYSPVNIDLSRANSIYGNSTTVQPPSVQYVRAMYLGKANAAAA